MSEQRFLDYLKELFPEEAKRTRSGLINKKFADRIVQYLKYSSDEDKNFRYRVKSSKFELLDFSEAGLRDILVVKVPEKEQVNQLPPTPN